MVLLQGEIVHATPLEKRKNNITYPSLLRDIKIHDGNLERQEMVVEAEIQNTDIGFVEPGQEADIKIDTYNYQKYGRLQGKVAYISPDAIEKERGKQTYRAEIAVAGDSLPGTGLSPGMQCSVEVKTDRRRVIAFFLGPLADALAQSLKVRRESITERRIL